MDLGSLLIMLGLILAVVAFLARPLIEEHASAGMAGDHRLSALQAGREAILSLIREIEMDHAMGKIGEEDFRQQRAELVARGAAVLRELDALDAAPAGEDVDAMIESAVAARRAAVGAARGLGFCTRCGHVLELGDRFCARCGAPVPLEPGA